MNYLKRWTVGLFSRIDGIVAQVENHEALVSEALRDLQGATARAKVQLRRVHEDGARLRSRLAEAREATATWRERARRSEDEKQAIECLRRSKHAARAAEQLTERLAEHERVQGQLARDVEGLESRLRTLKDKRNVMRTRQSRAEALGVVRGTDVQLSTELEDVFDRWETRVTEAEFAGGVSVDGPDDFEEQFIDEEEAAALRAELEELRSESDD